MLLTQLSFQSKTTEYVDLVFKLLEICSYKGQAHRRRVRTDARITGRLNSARHENPKTSQTMGPKVTHWGDGNSVYIPH